MAGLENVGLILILASSVWSFIKKNETQGFALLIVFLIVLYLLNKI